MTSKRVLDLDAIIEEIQYFTRVITLPVIGREQKALQLDLVFEWLAHVPTFGNSRNYGAIVYEAMKSMLEAKLIADIGQQKWTTWMACLDEFGRIEVKARAGLMGALIQQLKANGYFRSSAQARNGLPTYVKKLMT